MRRVGTFIFGRPRPLSRDRRANPHYTLNCEEPRRATVVVLPPIGKLELMLLCIEPP